MVIKKQRVLHIITRLDPGGSTTNTLETVARLDPVVYEADLIVGHTQDASGAAMAFVRQHGLRCVVLEDLVREISPRRDLKAFFRLYVMIRRGKYDIVHTHSSKAGILGRWAAFFAGVRKIVHTPHGHVFYGYFSRTVTQIFVWIERAAAGITTKLIALTDKGIDEHLAFGVGRREQWVTIPSGIDLALFHPDAAQRVSARREFGFADTDVVLVSVTRLDPVKNNTTLIAALAQAVREVPSVKLLFIGSGPEEAALKEQSRACGVAEHVVFAGFRQDVARLLNAGDIFVLASLNEGMGRSALEAMATGLPAIVSRAGGLPSIVADGKDGFLTDPLDAQAWARAVCLLALAFDLRHRMGAEACIRMTEKFGIDTMVRNIEKVYQA